MKILNSIEALTVRKGTLKLVPLYNKDQHPYDWDWKSGEGAFGLGTRGFTIKHNDLYHEFRLSHDKIYKLGEKQRPRKIHGELSQCYYGEKKNWYRWVRGSHSANLKDVYKVVFVDKETSKEFWVGNTYEVLDYFQPGEECHAYFSFNPYAWNGTGWNSWSNPNYVDVFDGEFEVDKSRMDIHDTMKRCFGNKVSHLEQLRKYTSIKF